MKVWLVWVGEYSDARVVGVYSSLELAQAAAQMHDSENVMYGEQGWIDNEDGYEVDAAERQIRDGVSRWSMRVRVDDGAISSVYQEGPGTGEPPSVELWPAVPSAPYDRLSLSCDARDKEHAVKIAGDERIKFLAVRTLKE